MIEDIIIFAIAGGVLGFAIVAPFVVRHREKKNWNNGKCPECGEQWIRYDTDSQGGRLHRCKNWHSCDITYNVDKNRKR